MNICMPIVSMEYPQQLDFFPNQLVTRQLLQNAILNLSSHNSRGVYSVTPLKIHPQMAAKPSMFPLAFPSNFSPCLVPHVAFAFIATSELHLDPNPKALKE